MRARHPELRGRVIHGRDIRRALGLATATGLLLATVVPSLAHAANTQPGIVRVNGDRLEYFTAPGFRNVVSLAEDPDGSGTFVMTDKSGIAAGSGCTQTTPTEAHCPSVGVRSVLVDLGDRYDKLQVNVRVPAVLYGDAGNDSIYSLARGTWADGGLGDDLIGAGRTDDTLYGGAGDDDIGGGFGSDLVLGGPGDDRVGGGYGTDDVRGEQGADLVLGGPNDDRLRGGPNDDQVNGEHGNDRLSGGLGSDILTGSNGDDQIESRDGQPDSVACGNDVDYVHADSQDTVKSNTCETVVVT